jgi:hypothetical protein
MTTNPLTEKLKKIFTEEAYGKPTTDNYELGINHNIRITLIEDPSELFGWNYRTKKSQWLSDKNVTYKSGNLEFVSDSYWDVKNDGSEIMHFKGMYEFYFYKIEELTEAERNILVHKKAVKEIELTKREIALQVLTEKLVQKMPSLNYLFTGDLEINHGIHLKEIKRGMHMHMPHKPRYGNTGWVANQVLGWGANIGWDITLDGKFVCCRVHYDDYINFEVEFLDQAEIETYKAKYQQTDKALINRLATLTEMFDRKLINETEYQQKKTEILNEL